MRKHLRGKRYLKSRASVKIGREKRLKKTIRKYMLYSDKNAFKKIKRMLSESLKTYMLREHVKEEREILYGTGEGEPVGFLKI